MTTPIADQLAAEADAIAADPTAAGPRWGAVHKLMLKAKVAPADAARVIVGRDVDGLRAVIAKLRGETSPNATAMPDAARAAQAAQPDDLDATPAPQVDAPTLKAAMRAFRKRLKVTRLDHESGLGVGPLTGGRAHEVDGILPPREFDADVWKVLVATGKLRDVGRGFLALTEEME